MNPLWHTLEFPYRHNKPKRSSSSSTEPHWISQLKWEITTTQSQNRTPAQDVLASFLTVGGGADVAAILIYCLFTDSDQPQHETTEMILHVLAWEINYSRNCWRNMTGPTASTWPPNSPDPNPVLIGCEDPAYVEHWLHVEHWPYVEHRLSIKREGEH